MSKKINKLNKPNKPNKKNNPNNPNKMSKKIRNLVSEVVIKTNSPFTLDKLYEIRMNILEIMKEKTTSYYLDKLQNITSEINKVIINDDFILQDNYWDSIFKGTFWMTEYPQLKQSYTEKNIQRLSLFNPTGVISIIEKFVDEIVDKIIGDSSWMTIQQQILFRSIISNYFKNHEKLWPIHLNMDLIYLKTTQKINKLIKKGRKIEKINIEDLLLKSALSGSGTFILKMLQQLHNNVNKTQNTSLFKITSDVFNNVPTLTKDELSFVMNSLNIEPSYKNKMDLKPLGSASIAQTHTTFSDKHNMKAVIKIIKPMYLFYFLCECEYLLTKVWSTISEYTKEMIEKIGESQDKQILYTKQARKILLFFIRDFIKEFDYYGEFVNTTIGYKENQKNNYPQIHSAIALDQVTDPFPVLILQSVSGTTLDNALKSNLSKKNLSTIITNVNVLISDWYKNTLWGSGFFHADLHPGNIMVNEGGELFIIDYGSCGYITKKQQCLLISTMILSGQITFLPETPNPNLNPNDKNDMINWKIHENNVKVCKKFVKLIWEVCDVMSYSEEHLDFVSESIMKYFPDRPIAYSELFIGVVKKSENIGSCTNNPIIFFGRALIYLGMIMLTLSEKCKEHNVCKPNWTMDAIISKNIIKNFAQVWNGSAWNFLTKGRVC